MSLTAYRLLLEHLIRGAPLFLKTNFGDPEKIADRRLRYLVKYAYENVPLYRRKYDAAGVKPADIRGVRDINKLPLITKQDLVAGYPNDILSKRAKPGSYVMVGTSGSTGVPVRVYKNRDLFSMGMVVWLFTSRLIDRYLNLKLKPRKLMSILIETPDSLEGVNAAEKRRLPAFAFRHTLDVDALSPVDEITASLNSFKPDVVFTYPSILRAVAAFSRQQNAAVHQPRLLVVSGELLDENTKNSIKQAFTGELLNAYFTTECGPMATECKEHTGMHLRTNAIILELLKNGQPVPAGQPGEVVVTDLWNEATPIIRYSGLKDVARFSTGGCPCPNKAPRLDVIEGRLDDSIVLKDGRVIHPFSLTLAIEHISGIARFQIIQDSFDDIRVLVVPENHHSPERASEIESALKKITGDSIAVHAEIIDKTPRTSNGHSGRVVISRVAREALS